MEEYDDRSGPIAGPVVDDEPRTSEALRRLLAAEGYQVRTAEQGSRALAFVGEWRPALVIADLTMAPMNGIELCRHIRVESKTPIIVVSADDSERSKVAALDSGANDYVVKPFAPAELLARVRAALRSAATVDNGGSLEAGVFRIDFDARRVYVRGRKIRLTPKEFDVVRLPRPTPQPGRSVRAAALRGLGTRQGLTVASTCTCSCASSARSSRRIRRGPDIW